MLEIFICSDTKALFLQELEAGNISEDAIVFIKDTKEIYTHGTYYAAGGGGEMPNLAKVATSGDYNDLENKPNIPDVSGFVTVATLDELTNSIREAFETKVDKTSVITSENINNDTLDWDKEYHFTMTRDISLGVYDKPNDDYAHSIEIEMTTGEDTYSFSTNLEIQWVKDLEIEPNKRYMIIIDDSMTAMWAAVERSDNE